MMISGWRIDISSVFRIVFFYSISFTETRKSRSLGKNGLCCGGACAFLHVCLYLFMDLFFLLR
jgi:hypothetical protein